MNLTHTQKILLLIISIFIIYYPIIGTHISSLFDPYLIHFEQCELFIQHRFLDPELFRNDYFLEYKSRFSGMIGYNWLNRVLVGYFDIYIIHKVIPIVLLAVTILAMGIAAWKLGGWYAAWTTSVLVLIHPIFSYQITSAIPHMFAYPFTACFLAALVYGRVYMMGVIVVLSALFYPITAVVAGPTMAFYLLITNQKSRGEGKNWSLSKRFILLLIVAAIPIWVVLSSLGKVDGYGEYIKPFTQTDIYPEVAESAKGGRHFYDSFMPVFYVLGKFLFKMYVYDSIDVFINLTLFFITMFVCFYGFRLFCKDLSNAVSKDRLQAFLWSILMLLVICYFSFYSYYYRLLIYILPLIYCLVLPVSLNAVIKDNRLARSVLPNIDSRFIVVILTIVFSLQINSTDLESNGYHSFSDEYKAGYEHIKTTDKDSMIAGWPNRRGFIEFVPYLAKRKAFITLKFHEPFYHDFIMEMRSRMYALTDAYLATDMEAIYNLRDKFGVDYLVVELDYFRNDKPPYYFNPFSKKIEELWMEGKGKFILPKLYDKAVFSHGNFYVLDLHKL
ncbi:MAG: hypothetical protein R3D71_10455 [Rickettsiales bacterium]